MAEARDKSDSVRNCVTTRAFGVLVTPFHLWKKKKPTVSHSQMFGCQYWYKTPGNEVCKLDACAATKFFVCYRQGTKAYKVWDDTQRRIVISRDLEFDESRPEPYTLDEHSPNENDVYFNQEDATDID